MLFSEQLLLAALDLIDRDCGMRKYRLFLSFPLHRIKKASLSFMCDFPTVIKYVSPWGRSHFSVLGMTGSYTVFPSLHQSCSIPFFCTCPAFSYAVLISHSQITVCMCYVLECISSFMRQVVCNPQCKHVLATLIAQRLSKCVVREMNKDDFIALLTRQISET